MVAMNSRHVVWLLSASLGLALQGRATVLPDSCGKDEVKFSVKAKGAPEGQPNAAIAPPEAGKAQIVFIEATETSGLILSTPTMRFGVDGEWVGANRGDSRFAVDVTPGVHHVCANWQSGEEEEARRVGLDSFTAEAGKVYYYEIKIVRKKGVGNNNMGGPMLTDVNFVFAAVSEDEGKFRVKASPPSTWKSHMETAGP
jgi:hypothetical protein